MLSPNLPIHSSRLTAHTEKATTLDENYLFGLKTLIEMLEDIASEGRTATHVYENQRYVLVALGDAFSKRAALCLC